MDERSLARRYTKALYSLAEEKNETPKLRTQLGSFATPQAAGLIKLLSHPILSRREKEGLIDAYCDQLKVSPLLQRFCLTLICARRANLLPFCASAFSVLDDLTQGRQRGTLYSAEPLNDQSRKQVVGALERALKKVVLLEEQQDPSLIAGVRVVVGSKIFDNSLKKKLELIRESFSGI